MLIFIFMTYYLIAVSCPGLSSDRVKRNLAIYVDRSSSLILGVGVVWPFGRRCCCNNRTSPPSPTTMPRNPMPTTLPATDMPPAVTEPTTAPAAPADPSESPAQPETTPMDTATVTPVPLHRQKIRGRGRGLLIRPQSQWKQKLNDGCSCSTALKSGYRRQRSHVAESSRKSRLSVTPASGEKDAQKGAKLAVNATSVPDRNSSAGLREERFDPERSKRGCILFRSRVYCMRATG